MNSILNFKFLVLSPLFLVLILSGCAETPEIRPVTRTYAPSTEPGIYHPVQKGETLWRISKVYGVDIQRIIDSNQLADAAKIEVGQRIFIPGVTRTIDISPTLVSQYEKDKFIWPAQGRVVSYFGTNTEGGLINRGIDIQTESDSNIVASRDGVVLFASSQVRGLGNTIILDHEDGYFTLYANNALNLVRPGQRVQRSQVIAKVGNTGRAKRPNLHFQIRKGHKSQNPFYFLPD